jgi:hypothetical protein
MAGKIRRGGLVEVPMGMTIGEIVYGIGGGPSTSAPIKAVQTGGPSGGCIPEEHLDIKVDFDELTKVGAIMGSGGMIVMDESTCMVDVAKYFREDDVDGVQTRVGHGPLRNLTRPADQKRGTDCLLIEDVFLHPAVGSNISP